MIRQRQAFGAGLFIVLTYYNICGYIILQMNRKSVKGCTYDNKHQEVEEVTSKKLAGKGQNSRNNRVKKSCA